MEMVTSATFPAREGDVLKERVMDERQLAALFRTNRELVQSKGEDNLSKNSKSLTSEEATHQAQFFVGEIFDARQRLRAIVATYSATIRKRWLKKTSEKRKALLLSAWPDIPEQHRPDIIYLPIIYLSSGDSTIRLTAAQEKAIIFPHINLEDLSTFRTFLLLLGSRTYYTPDVFASADLSSVRVGIQFNAIRSGSLFGHTMHLVGQTKREEYGRITSWTDNLESSYKWVTGTGTQVSHGLIILKIQANVLGFLLRSTELILHHVPMDSISISKNINLPFGSLSLQNGPDAGRSSHLQSLTEAPYEVPEQYEFGRLHGYINAKHNEMEDQMWSLREDPSCFLNLAWEESEHQHETTINNDWGQDPALQTQSFCERVFTGMISNLYRDVMLWNSVWRELQDLETLRQRYKSDIIPGQSLPTEYRQALSLFGSTLDRIVSMKRPEFQTAVQGCPGLRKYFSNVSDRGKGDSMRKGVKIDVDDHLWFLLWQLCYIENTEAWGYDNLLDEIERIIESDRKQSQRLSPRTKKLMSDLAIPAELQRQITLSFPGGQVVSALTVSDFKAKANEISKLINSMRKALQLEKGIGRFGLEMDAVCYPVDKKRTAETTAQMRSAEQHFDAFWSAVDEHVVRHTGMAFYDLLGGSMKPRKLARTSK